MTHLGRVHGIQISWIAQECAKVYVASGYMLSDKMAANIHTKAFPEERREEWVRHRQTINVFNMTEDVRLIGRPGHGFVNLQDCPQNYARKDTSLSTVTDDQAPTSASATLVPSRRGRRLCTVVKVTPNALTVGADCAGMGSGIEAVLRVCPSANIVFASEKDDETRAHLLNNFYIGDQRSDVSNRPARFDQHVDLYICGFPCQPYSSAGHDLASATNGLPSCTASWST